MGHCCGDDHEKQYVQLPPLCLRVQLLMSLWFSNNFGFPFFLCSGSTSTALTYTPAAFRYASAFNANISKWDTARVTTMDSSTSNFHLFVFLFNCLFHELVVSLTILGFFFSCSGSTATALTYTPTAFEYAFAFNADISKWDTGQVTTMISSTSKFHLSLSSCFFVCSMSFVVL